MPTGERAKQERMYRAKRRAREAETTQARNTRVAEDRASHSHARANESPETSRAKRQRMREAKRSEREVQLDPARDGRLSVDRASHQEMQRVRREQARHGTHNLARCDDTDFFRERFMASTGTHRARPHSFYVLNAHIVVRWCGKRRGKNSAATPVKLTVHVTPQLSILVPSRRALRLLLWTISLIRTL